MIFLLRDDISRAACSWEAVKLYAVIADFHTSLFPTPMIKSRIPPVSDMQHIRAWCLPVKGRNTCKPRMGLKLPGYPLSVPGCEEVCHQDKIARPPCSSSYESHKLQHPRCSWSRYRFWYPAMLNFLIQDEDFWCRIDFALYHCCSDWIRPETVGLNICSSFILAHLHAFVWDCIASCETGPA